MSRGAPSVPRHRGLLVAMVLAALAGCASVDDRGSRDNSTAVGRAFCTSLDYSSIVQTKRRPAEGYLRVPLAIHVMDRHGAHEGLRHWTAFVPESGRLHRDPERPDVVAMLFGVTSAHAVNTVWEKARIRFVVELVEHCAYAPPVPAMVDDNVRPPEPALMFPQHPTVQRGMIDGYLALNRLYGLPRMVNLYLWGTFLEEGTDGYGESPRRDRVEVRELLLDPLSAAWVKAGVCDTTHPEEARECQILVAHELGHALGLKHVCRPCKPACCTDVCWAPRDRPYHDDYHFYKNVAVGAAVCRPMPQPPAASCCCGCEPGVEARDGLNVCGERLACCDDRDDVMRARLMHPKPRSKDDLCEGEIHSVRSAVREFFFDVEGGGR